MSGYAGIKERNKRNSTGTQKRAVILSMGFNLTCAPEKGQEFILYLQRFSGTILICRFNISVIVGVMC